MITKKKAVFNIFGFEVRLDLTWFFLVALITWSLATGFFPSKYEDLSVLTYWLMGLSVAFGIFASIVLHEVSHSLVARRYGIPIRGITLFVFGGVAQMEDEPPSPQAEFAMAIAGPLMSIVIALVFYGLSRLAQAIDLHISLFAVLRYLAIMNGALAIFNIVPAFPLDGGRLLRSAIWNSKGNLLLATRISSRIGSAFGFALIAFGVVNLFMGSFVGGMWWFLIGLFLNNAARSSYQQVLYRNALEGVKVSRFMKTDLVTVPRGLTIEQFVEDYVYKYHHKLYPVVERGKLLGCVTVKLVKTVPRAEWGMRTVGDLVEHCSKENMVDPDTDAKKVLLKMKQAGTSRLMVVKDAKLVGIIALKDLLEFISLRSELEEDKM